MEKKPEITHTGQHLHEKKQYRSPQLVIYGSIREITRNLGEKGALDAGGGAGMGPKTQT
jgi:hypothetical protein